MKNKIEYYYRIENINLHEQNNIYNFLYNNKKYIFFNTTRNIKEIEQIYLLQSIDERYYKIILNRNRNVITVINNKQYLLVEIINYGNRKITFDDLTNKKSVTNLENSNTLLRNDWYNLWIKKVDYINYQRVHFNKEYLLLDDYLDYFLGLAENAISYIQDATAKEKKDERDELVISHRRINSNLKKIYYNVENIVLDHISRDVSEYLKYLFFNEELDYNTVANIINSLNFSRYGYRLLFGRMLFPSHFCDIYENIINNSQKELEIKKITLKICDYENYLKFIFQEINKKTKLPIVEWLT